MRIKKRVLFIPLALILLIGVFFLWNYIQNQSPHVTFYQMETTKNIKGLRIVSLTDLHLREFGEGNERLVRTLERLRPDLIAMVGDMTIEDNPDHSVPLALIRRLSQLAPVYYSSGNHEYTDILYNKESTLIADIEAAGATYVDDRYVEVQLGRNKLVLGAVCKNADDVMKYSSSREMLQSFCAESRFRLLLSHYPEIFLSAMADSPVDLALCGHAHGGQVRLPFLKDGLYAPDQGFFPTFTSGMRTACGSTVVISRGLGDSSKSLRINNPPEVVVVDIN